MIFLVMLFITRANGIDYFISPNLVRQVLVDGLLSSMIALAIYIQFKHGRFDFSGGATILLTAIFGGNIALLLGQNPIIFIVVSIVVGIVLSIITATVYIKGKLPIIICTIGMTLIYEAFTYLVFDADGLKILTVTSLTKFGRLPGIFVPFILAYAVFIIFSYYTKSGREAKILAHNQEAGVNIGINEKRNVLVTYIFSGVIIGLAAVVYGSQNTIAPQANLSTAGILFSFIVPVFIGMFIGKASFDALGIIIAAIGMEIFNYGLDCLGLGAGGWQQIIMGMFMIGFYSFSAKAGQIRSFFMRKAASPAAASESV